MSQPASLKEPRDGETVLACQHDFEWKRKPLFIGHIQDGQRTGLGRLVQRPGKDPLWIRWIVLCAWCRFWRWAKRQDPIKRARREIVWGSKP